MPKTALVVENDENWLGLERRALESLGYECITATNATAGIEALSSATPEIVITDLHMNGDNGDRVIQYALERELSTPIVIASGTLSDAAKKALAEGLPGTTFFAKSDFLKPEVIKLKLADVFARPVKNQASSLYLDAIQKAKDSICSIEDILVQTDRIKGRVFGVLGAFESSINPEDYSALAGFDYYGATPEATASRIHELKNSVTGIAEKYSRELRKELLRISDDIVQVINQPRNDAMPLDELVGRITGNMDNVHYGMRLEIDIPPEIEIDRASKYWQILYSLIENAVQASFIPEYGVYDFTHISYNEKGNPSLLIRNPGKFPEEWLDKDSQPIVGKIKSTKPFGTGFGIAEAFAALQKQGMPLFIYNTEEGVVTEIPLHIPEHIADPSSVVVEGNPKVLFLDYQNGGRFTGIEQTIKRLDPRFGYVWRSDLNYNPELLADYDFSDHFLVVFHSSMMNLKDHLCMLISEREVAERTPNLRYGQVCMVDPTRNIHYFSEDNPDLKIEERFDFWEPNLPAANVLNQLIIGSYVKYKRSLKP